MYYTALCGRSQPFLEVYFRQKEARVGRGHILPRLQGLEVEREGTCSTSKNTVAEF